MNTFNLGNLSDEIFVVFVYFYKTRYAQTIKLLKLSIKLVEHVICAMVHKFMMSTIYTVVYSFYRDIWKPLRRGIEGEVDVYQTKAKQRNGIFDHYNAMDT